MKKVLAMVLALVMMASFMAGCGGAAADTDENAIRIGMTGPLTGGNAMYGNAVKVGMEIAVEEINALGGLQLAFKSADDEADNEKGLNAYNDLKDWGMQIFAGATTTNCCITIAPEAVTDQTFMMTPSGSAPAIAMAGANVYQMCFTDPNQGAASAELIAATMADAVIGVIYDSSTDYSTGVYKTFMAKAQELGLNVPEEAVTSFNASNASEMKTQLTKMKEAGCTLVFMPIYATEASTVLNNAASMNYNPVFFGCDGMDGILAVDGFDPALAEGLVMMTPFAADADDETTKAFVAKYKEKTNGEIPNQFAADAYDVIYAIYEGCKAMGVEPSMDNATISQKLMEYFATATFSGLTGQNMTWDANGMVSKVPTAVVVENGVYVKK